MTKPEDAILEQIDKVMDNFADRVLKLARDNINEPRLKTFKSGKTKVTATAFNGQLAGLAFVDSKFLQKTVSFPVPYASDVEFGNAGFPIRPEELITWVRRKVLKNKPASDVTILRIATNIANSLATLGQSADPFLEPAIAQANNEFKVKVIK